MCENLSGYRVITREEIEAWHARSVELIIENIEDRGFGGYYHLGMGDFRPDGLTWQYIYLGKEMIGMFQREWTVHNAACVKE